jgi:hypothetical protein
MNTLQWWLGVLGELILAGILVGLLVRRRAGRCYSFTVYVTAVLICEVLITALPGPFHTWNFWVFKEILLTVIKFAIALELTARIFRAFPGARSTARGVTLVVVSVSLAAVLALPAANPGFPELASHVFPRIVNGTIWLFTALAAVILWYRLPVDLFHKAILVGFVPYLLVFTVALNLLVVFEGREKWLEMASYLQSAAYVLLLGYWGYAAWRPLEGRVRAPEAPREVTQPM